MIQGLQTGGNKDRKPRAARTPKEKWQIIHEATHHINAGVNRREGAFSELLNIRYSSELFRMATLEEVQRNLSFLNTGQNQTPGLIVMKLDANGGNYGPYNHIVVIFNATNAAVTFIDSRLQGLALHLHPVQRNSSDPTTRQSAFNSKAGTATVPALTSAVFVAETE